MVYPWRSFEAYPGLVTMTGAASVQVPNRADGNHDLDAMAAAITERTRVVIVCTPNNPTGTHRDRRRLRSLHGTSPGDLLVLLDEACYEFVTDDAVDGIPLLSRYPNLVVLRSRRRTVSPRCGSGTPSGRRPCWTRLARRPSALGDRRVAGRGARLDRCGGRADGARRPHRHAARPCATLFWRRAGPFRAQGSFGWLATAEQTAEVNDAFFDAGLTVRAFPPEGIRISVGEEESVDKLLQVAGDIVQNLPSGHPGKRLG
ncbi:aminotransferase class I/II-fold pyridoxal phosphate-dependent enzyme [Leifsonia sp. L25]|uniref:aminotransferase class I/II-fold pyridoxal phosphate-dependent enzyme n=1 Tax=Leifsonia sp. L25 TaxID=3423957 RepID=UPI003D6860A7